MEPKENINIKELIKQGEHLQQDFKYKITNVSKIAHSISSFANTSGGRLLVGVRDNGTISGIDSDEEIYMIDAAAQSYCIPSVKCIMEIIRENGKNVLIASIPPMNDKPIMAKEEDGSLIAYVRINDENIVANPVHLAMWRNSKDNRTITQNEYDCLKIIPSDGISLNKFTRKSGLRRKIAIDLLADFVRCELIEMKLVNHKWMFCSLD